MSYRLIRPALLVLSAALSLPAALSQTQDHDLLLNPSPQQGCTRSIVYLEVTYCFLGNNPALRTLSDHDVLELAANNDRRVAEIVALSEIRYYADAAKEEPGENKYKAHLKIIRKLVSRLCSGRKRLCKGPLTQHDVITAPLPLDPRKLLERVALAARSVICEQQDPGILGSAYGTNLRKVSLAVAALR